MRRFLEKNAKILDIFGGTTKPAIHILFKFTPPRKKRNIDNSSENRYDGTTKN